MFITMIKQGVYQNETINPPMELDFYYYLWLSMYTILFFYSISRLLNKNANLNQSKRMRCPNCNNEPYSLVHWTKGISFKKFMKGNRKCIHCGSILKIHYSNWFWGSGFILSTVYLMYLIPFLFGADIYAHEKTFIVLIGIGVIGFSAAICMIISIAFATRYELIKGTE